MCKWREGKMTYIPGRFGQSETRNAMTARQFVPASLYRYLPLERYKAGTSMARFFTIQKSAARIAAIGAKNVPRPAMKLRRLDAEWMIFHGTIIHPAVTVVMITPRRMLIY